MERTALIRSWVEIANPVAGSVLKAPDSIAVRLEPIAKVAPIAGALRVPASVMAPPRQWVITEGPVTQ